MEKLELKHLCGYLPWGLKVQSKLGYGDLDYKGRIKELTTINIDKIDGVKWAPLLLPLSALTEPLEDGSVPIVELIKIQFKRWNSDYNINDVYDIEFQQNVDWSCGMDHFILPCIWVKIDGYCYEITLGEMTLTWVNEYLYSKHFDINNCIPAGLAIDKRTLTPYPH